MKPMFFTMALLLAGSVSFAGELDKESSNVSVKAARDLPGTIVVRVMSEDPKQVEVLNVKESITDAKQLEKLSGFQTVKVNTKYQVAGDKKLSELDRDQSVHESWYFYLGWGGYGWGTGWGYGYPYYPYYGWGASYYYYQPYYYTPYYWGGYNYWWYRPCCW